MYTAGVLQTRAPVSYLLRMDETAAHVHAQGMPELPAKCGVRLGKGTERPAKAAGGALAMVVRELRLMHMGARAHAAAKHQPGTPRAENPKVT